MTVRVVPNTALSAIADRQNAIYREAFSLVCNPVNWKLPISAKVPKESCDLFREAVIFMTGSVPEFASISGDQTNMMMYADGYYAAVGA
jgi:hypothetical protein